MESFSTVSAIIKDKLVMTQSQRSPSFSARLLSGASGSNIRVVPDLMTLSFLLVADLLKASSAFLEDCLISLGMPIHTPPVTPKFATIMQYPTIFYNFRDKKKKNP